MADQDYAKVFALQIRNVGPLEVLDMEPKGSVVEVRGRNAVGKSTALTALAMLLEGGNAIKKLSIRDGSSKGSIVGVIGETRETAMVFRRDFRRSGSNTFTVEDADGMMLGSPQKVADKLIGSRTVRAQAFCELKEAEQSRVLADLAGIDLKKFDDDKDSVFLTRTNVSRDVKMLTSQLDGIPFDKAVGTKPRSISELTARLQESNDLNTRNSNKRRVLREAEEIVVRAAQSQSAAESALKTARQVAEDAESKFLESSVHVETQSRLRDEAKENAACLVDPVDPNEIQSQIAECEGFNATVTQNLRHDEIKNQLLTVEGKALELTDKLEKIKENRDAAIREGKMPVDGLAWTDNGVMFNDRPFKYASTAEALTVSVAIGCARAGGLRAITFDNGEVLDSLHRAKLYKMVHDAHMLVMIAIVEDGGEGVRIVEVDPEDRQGVPG